MFSKPASVAVMKMCHTLHVRSTKHWLRPDFLFNLSSYSKDQGKLLDTIHSLSKRVLKKKKETYEKNKSAILNSIWANSTDKLNFLPEKIAIIVQFSVEFTLMLMLTSPSIR
uniref:Cytochrome P450 4g15 n=1 Tax=Cacopsylla melanoneura TaxID=428564 RepID=A0A8D8M5B0_9HEMI